MAHCVVSNVNQKSVNEEFFGPLKGWNFNFNIESSVCRIKLLSILIMSCLKFVPYSRSGCALFTLNYICV